MLVLRFAWLAPLALAGCVRDDPDHCANKDGDATCEENYGGGFCSSCTAKHDGCVELLADVPPSCRPDGATSVADDTTQTSATSPMTDTVADDSAGTTTTLPTTSADSDEGGSSTGTVDVPRCGNNMIEQFLNENCDGTQQPFDTCSDVGLMGGNVSCYEPGSDLECTYNLSECMGTSQCHNDEIEVNEQCEDDVPLEETCQGLSDMFIGGDLDCVECKYNTTGCQLCAGDGDPCATTEDCCGSALCIGLPPVCVL